MNRLLKFDLLPFSHMNSGVEFPLDLEYYCLQHLEKKPITPSCTRDICIFCKNDLYNFVLCIPSHDESAIENFMSLERGKSYDFSFHLKPFGINNIKWVIKIFPNGIDDSCGDYMSIYLGLQCDKFSDSIKLYNNNSHAIVSFGLGRYDVDNFKIGDFKGIRIWKKRSDYQEYINTIVKPCALIQAACCNVRNLKLGSHKLGRSVNEMLVNIDIKMFTKVYDRFNTVIHQELSSIDSPEYQRHIAFNSTTDLTIQFGDKSYFVHKDILVNSSDVFKAMLEGDTKESQTNVIVVNILIDEMSIDYIFGYFYFKQTDSENIDKIDWLGVLEFSDYYNIKTLRELACNHLLRLMNLNNAIDCLLIAHKLSLDTFKLITKKFVMKNANDIRKTESWQKLTLIPDLCLEILNDTVASYNHEFVDGPDTKKQRTS